MASKKILVDIDVDGSVESTSFIKSGGTSAQFLKADGSVDTSTYLTSTSLPDSDNYQSWNLKTNGTQRKTIQSGNDLDLVAGTDISLSYSAGGVVTIDSTDTLATVTGRGATTTTESFFNGNLNTNKLTIHDSASNLDYKFFVGRNDTQGTGIAVDDTGTTITTIQDETVENFDHYLAFNIVTQTDGTPYYKFQMNNTQLLKIEEAKATFSNDVHINGDLTITGTYTQIDTDVNTTEQWLVTNDGTGPAAIINQIGVQDIIDIQDDGTSVFYIEDGGNIGVGTTDPTEKLEVVGNIKTDGIFSDGDTDKISDIVFYRENTPIDALSSFILSKKDGGYSTNSTKPSGESNAFGVISLQTHSGDYFTQVGLGTQTNSLYIRSTHGSTSLGSWKKIITEDDQFATGIGTDNYLVKWDGANGDLQNSIIHDNGTNVGIGTNSPTNNFHVKNSDGAIFRLEAADNGGAPSDTVYCLIDGFEGRGAGIKIRDSVNSASAASNRSWWVGSGYGLSGFNIAYSSDGSSSSYGSNTKFYINTDGDVGIGTISPDARLTLKSSVSNSTNSGIKIIGNTTSNSIIDLFENGTDGGGVRLYDGGVIKVDIRSNASTYFNGGNVGIGTASPSVELDVNGDIKASNFVSIQSIDTGNPAPSADETRVSGYGLAGNRGVYYITNVNGAGSIHLGVGGTHAAATKMTIKSNGNVGIGTENPAAGLQVALGGTSIPAAGSSTASAVFGNSTSDDNYGLVMGATSGGVGYIGAQRTDGSTTTYNLAIQPNGGYVGVGTGTPNELLHVSSDAAATEAYLNITSSTVPRMRLGYSFTDGPSISDADAWVTVDSAGDLDISSRGNVDSNIILYTSDGTTHSEKMRIMGDGDIGIGTASPEEKLHVIGNARADSFGSEESSTLTRVFSPKGASFKGAATETGFICITLPQGFTNTMMSFVVNVYDYATNESMKIKVFGYTYSVASSWFNATAIIDSSPFKDRNFPVKFGTDGTKAVVSIGDVGDTWTYTNVSVTEFVGSHSNFALEDWNDGWGIGILNSTTGYSFNITENNNQVNNWGRNGDDLYYSSGTGNVGIGVTSPSYKLDVSGEGNFSNYLNVGASFGIRSTGWVHLHRFSSSSKVAVGQSGTNVDLVVPNGKVGIGTDSPTEELMVEGSIALSMGDDAMATITPKFEGIEFRVDDGAYSSSSVDMSLQDSTTGTGLNVYGYIESAFNTDEDGGGSFRVIRTIDGATNNPRSYSDKTILTNPSTSAISYAGIDINAQMDDGTYGHHTAFQLRTSLETATVGDYEGVYTQAYNFVDATVTNYVGSTTKTPFAFDADSSITNMIGNHVIAEDANGSLTNLYGLKIETGTSPATNMWSVHAPDVDMNALMAGNLEVGSISVGTSVTSNKLEVAGTGRFDNNGVGDKVALIVRNGDSSSSTSRATTEYWVGTSDYAEVSVGGSSGYGDIEFRTRATSSMNTSMKIHGTGNVTIGTTAVSSDKLHVEGTVKSSSTFTGTNFILSSDSRLKQNVQEAEVSHIDVDWKSFELKSEKGQKRYGVIAQELEQKHPEFVRTDGEGMKSVAYVDLLIAKIAELEARLEKAGL